MEDLCYFFVPMEELARVAGIDVPVTTGMVDILAVLTGYDYRREALTLDDLGFDGRDRKQILRVVNDGGK